MSRKTVKRVSPLAVAIHEAGHAVVQLARPPAPYIESISIVGQREGVLGLVETSSFWKPYMAEAARAAPADILDQWRRLAWQDIVISLAGPLAEFRWGRHSRWAIMLNADRLAKQCLEHPLPDPFCDEAKVRERLTWAFPGEEQQRFSAAWLETEEAVATHWRAITSIGRTLHQRGRLTGEELKVEWARFA